STGDTISLSAQGPVIKVELIEDGPLRLAPENKGSKSQVVDKLSETVLIPESDPLIPIVSPQEQPSAKKTKPLASAIIPTLKDTDSTPPANAKLSKPPSSSTVKTSTVKSSQPQSSMTIPTTIPLSETIKTTGKSSTEIPTAKKSGTHSNA